MHCESMLTKEPGPARADVARDVPPDRALGELLDGLHRIVDGFGGIAEALIARPGPSSPPAPSLLLADERRAMDVIDAAVIDGITRDLSTVTVPTGWLAVVYQLACRHVNARHEAKA